MITSGAEHLVTTSRVGATRTRRTHVLATEALLATLASVHRKRMKRAIVACAFFLVRAVSALLNSVTTMMSRNACVAGVAENRRSLTNRTIHLISAVITINKTVTTMEVVVAVTQLLRVTVLLIASVQTVTTAITTSATMHTRTFVLTLESQLWIALLAHRIALRIETGARVLPLVMQTVVTLEVHAVRSDVNRLLANTRTLNLILTNQTVNHSVTNVLLLDANVRGGVVGAGAQSILTTRTRNAITSSLV